MGDGAAAARPGKESSNIEDEAEPEPEATAAAETELRPLPSAWGLAGDCPGNEVGRCTGRVNAAGTTPPALPPAPVELAPRPPAAPLAPEVRLEVASKVGSEFRTLGRSEAAASSKASERGRPWPPPRSWPCWASPVDWLLCPAARGKPGALGCEAAFDELAALAWSLRPMGAFCGSSPGVQLPSKEKKLRALLTRSKAPKSFCCVSDMKVRSPLSNGVSCRCCCLITNRSLHASEVPSEKLIVGLVSPSDQARIQIRGSSLPGQGLPVTACMNFSVTWTKLSSCSSSLLTILLFCTDPAILQSTTQNQTEHCTSNRLNITYLPRSALPNAQAPLCDSGRR